MHRTISCVVPTVITQPTGATGPGKSRPHGNHGAPTEITRAPQGKYVSLRGPLEIRSPTGNTRGLTGASRGPHGNTGPQGNTRGTRGNTGASHGKSRGGIRGPGRVTGRGLPRGGHAGSRPRGVTGPTGNHALPRVIPRVTAPREYAARGNHAGPTGTRLPVIRAPQGEIRGPPRGIRGPLRGKHGLPRATAPREYAGAHGGHAGPTGKYAGPTGGGGGRGPPVTASRRSRN